MCDKKIFKELYYNHISKNVNRETGEIHIHGNTVINLHNSAEINLNGNLHLCYNVLYGSKSECFLNMKESSRLNVNGYFRLYYGSTIQVFKNAVLTLGTGYINSNSVIACSNSITIEDGATIARGVHIYDSDFHSILNENGDTLNSSAPIYIGKHVWIGVDSVILKGVNIGEGAVIGAGSVVNKDIPPNCLAVGNPAKIIKENVIWK